MLKPNAFLSPALEQKFHAIRTKIQALCFIQPIVQLESSSTFQYFTNVTVYTLFFAPIRFINLMLFNSNNESKESRAKSCFKSKMLQKNSEQENKTRAVSDLAGDSIKK